MNGDPGKGELQQQPHVMANYRMAGNMYGTIIIIIMTIIPMQTACI